MTIPTTIPGEVVLLMMVAPLLILSYIAIKTPAKEELKKKQKSTSK